MPLDYTDIDLDVLFGNGNYNRYIGRVINSGEKITQEVEFDIHPCNIHNTARDDFMKALGTKFIRYGFYDDYHNEFVWTNWYSINYDLGEYVPKNVSKLFRADE